MTSGVIRDHLKPELHEPISHALPRMAGLPAAMHQNDELTISWALDVTNQAKPIPIGPDSCVSPLHRADLWGSGMSRKLAKQSLGCQTVWPAFDRSQIARSSRHATPEKCVGVRRYLATDCIAEVATRVGRRAVEPILFTAHGAQAPERPRVDRHDLVSAARKVLLALLHRIVIQLGPSRAMTGAERMSPGSVAT